MSDLFRLFERRASAYSGVHPSSGNILDFFGGGANSKSGLSVTPDSALSLSAVFACVQVRSQTLASLPLKLFRRGKNGDKTPAIEHPAYRIVHTSPHPELTSLEFFEMMVGHLDLRGNAYAQIVRDNGGRIRRLVPLHPDRVRVLRSDNYTPDGLRSIRYEVTNEGLGGTAKLEAYEVLHFRGWAPDGVCGWSPIRIGRESIGLALAADEHAARSWANGATPRGVLEHPGHLGDDGRKNLRDSWASVHGGVANSGKVAILEENMKFHQVGLSNEDSQLLESRKYSRTEIASIYRVPPHKIGDLEKATFSNIEQQSIEFVQDCMLPLCVRHEQRLNLSLLTPEEQGEYFFAFNLAGLLRGDLPSRYAAYRVGLGRAGEPGWLSVNDIRETEDMNRIEGGDSYSSGQVVEPIAKTARATLRPLFVDALSRTFRKEAKAIRAIVKKPDAPAEIDRFYTEHRRHLVEVIAPLADALRQLGGTAPDPLQLAASIVTQSRSSLGASPVDGDTLEQQLTAWETTRATNIVNDLLNLSSA